jgi:hypothetical protein
MVVAAILTDTRCLVLGLHTIGMRHIITVLIIVVGVAWLGLIVLALADASAIAMLFANVSRIFGAAP